jgi:membrane protein DedA with SNARE-associated domain
MPTLESIIEWLQGMSPMGVYIALFITTYVENVFPPSPSDAVMLFIATLIGIGTIGHVPAIAVATVGSTLGFLTAFTLGRRYGRRWIATNKVPFLKKESLAKVDGWFDKYGYWVIVGNRFLAGTRAVVSFFAGMSKLDLLKTTILCTISALVWNSIIIVLGALLGENWREGEAIISKYGWAVTGLLVALVLFFAIRWYMRKSKG